MADRLIVAFVFVCLIGVTSCVTSSCEPAYFRQLLRKKVDCTLEHVDLSVVLGQLNRAIGSCSQLDYMKTNCPKWRSGRDCYYQFHQHAGDCLNEISSAKARITRKLFDDLVDFFCKDNGQIVYDFVASDGLTCLRDHGSELKTCVDILDKNITQINDVIGNIFPFFSKGFYEDQLTRHCKEWKTASRCVFNVFRKNCSASSQEFMFRFYNMLNLRSPCSGVVGHLDEIQLEHFFFAAFLPTHIPTNWHKCPNGLTAFEHAKHVLIQAGQCLVENRLWEDTEFAAEDFLRTIMSQSHIRKYCQKLYNISACVSDFLDSFQPCVRSQDNATLDSTKRVVMMVVDYICQDGAENLYEFLMDDGLRCALNMKRDIKGCVKNNTKSLFQASDNVRQTFASQFGFWVPQNYTYEECKYVDIFGKCSRKSFAQCPKSTPMFFVKNLFEIVMRESPCGSMDFSKASALPAATYVIFAVISVGLATSVRSAWL